MKANLTIDCIEEIPTRVIQSLDKKISKRNQIRFYGYSECLYRASLGKFSFFMGEKAFNKRVVKNYHRNRERADTGFINTSCKNFPVWRGYW